MHKLTHFRLCPRSRSLRLVASELGVTYDSVEQEPWAIGPEFLVLNPAGELPVFEIDGGPILCGIYAAAEHLGAGLVPISSDVSTQAKLFAENAEDRSEVRRLADWFHHKLDREVTRELLFEKLYARMAAQGPQGPDAEILRVARSNLKYHLSYISYLADQRAWLAGETLTFADLAAASHISTLDYLGEIDWASCPGVKTWYQRIKSRPSFRPLLGDRIAGTPPPEHYANLDF